MTKLKPQNQLYISFIIASAIGVITISCFSISLENCGLLAFAVLLIFSSSSYVCGFFLGFLFAIPKYKENLSVRSNYTINNNLIEISDWLTKMIVGIGLIQLKNIPYFLNNLGQKAAKYFNSYGCNQGEKIILISNSCIIFFSVFGVYYGYNYARLILSLNYREADSKLNLKVLDKVSEKLNIYNDANAETFKRIFLELEVIQNDDLEIISEKINLLKQSNLKYPRFFDLMLYRAKEKMRAGMELNSEKSKIEKDPQKDQWGGLSHNNHKKIFGELKIINEYGYEVEISVISSSPENHPLKNGTVVMFALHNTYDNPFKIITVKDETASLSLVLFGSFTIGVLIKEDFGYTELEYDLALIPGAPKKFIYT